MIDHDPVHRWFNSYRPKDVPPDIWEHVLRPFVAECLTVHGSFPHLAAVQRYARVLSKLAQWCLQEGLPLDREVVLSAPVVERYATMALTGPGGPTYRSDLRRIAPLLTKHTPWPPQPPVLGRRKVAPCYSDGEMARLWQAVDTQSTPHLRQAGRALFLLGAGAGLDGRWVTSVEARHVRVLQAVLVVEVGEPKPRTVPVLAAFAARLRALTMEVGAGTLSGLDSEVKNALSRTTARLKMPSGVPPLAMSRLRSTWLRVHLQRHTRLPELVTAAGLDGLTVLSDLLPQVTRLPFEQYCPEVAGSEGDGEDNAQ